MPVSRRRSATALSSVLASAVAGVMLVTLPVLPASAAPAASAAPSAPAAGDPCGPLSHAAEGRGLDGGLGCVPDREVEGASAKLTANTTGDLARAGTSGLDRLRAVEQTQALRARVEAQRVATGADAFATGAGFVRDSASSWRSVGPNPLNFDEPGYPSGAAGLGQGSGRVSALAIDPRDLMRNTVYVGAAAGGVWRSTDGGTTWTSVFDAQATQSIGALAVAPNGWVYAGTGEPNTGTDNYAGVGVYRSKDDGATWERNAQVPADTVISKITLVGSTVFVATSKGLWRSTDGGDTYTNTNLPTNEAGTAPGTIFLQNFVTDVVVRPGVPSEITAAVGWRSGGVPGKGLYRSTNGGASFTRFTGTGFGINSTTSDPIGRISLAYAEGPGQDNKILWAVVEDAGKLNNDSTPLSFPGEPAAPARVPFTVLNGIYRSGDDGASWTLKGEYDTLVAAPGSAYTPTFTASQSGPGVQSWYNQYIVVDPGNVDRVLVGLEEIFQTTANANTPGVPAQWSVVGRYSNTCSPVNVACPVFPAGSTTVHPDQHAAALALLPGGKTRAYVGNDGGPYRQDRAAAESFTSEAWTALPKLATHQFHAAVIGSDGTIYGGMQDNGTTRIDATTGRAVEVLGGDGFDVAVDPANSDVMYDEVQVGAMRKSTNGGKTQTTITPSGATRMQFFTPFEMDPTDAKHIVYGAGQIFETTVGSATTSSTWTQVIDLVGANAVNALDTQGAVSYAAFCGECNASPNLANGGVYDPTIFTGGIATNAKPGCAPAKGSAACWHVAAAAGLPKRFVGGMSIDPQNPSTVYVAVSSYRRRFLYDTPARTEPGGILYRSTDAGETFTDISGDLPETFAADVILQGGRLVVATDTGVFANATVDSAEFVPFGSGIPVGVPAYDLSTNPAEDTILLATHGRGLYTLAVGAAPDPVVPEAPLTVLLPLSALLAAAVLTGVLRRRRRVIPLS